MEMKKCPNSQEVSQSLHVNVPAVKTVSRVEIKRYIM